MSTQVLYRILTRPVNLSAAQVLFGFLDFALQLTFFTPVLLPGFQQDRGYTRVNFRCKFLAQVDQFQLQINRQRAGSYKPLSRYTRYKEKLV